MTAPTWKCVESHTEKRIVLVPQTGARDLEMWTPYQVCDRYERVSTGDVSWVSAPLLVLVISLAIVALVCVAVAGRTVIRRWGGRTAWTLAWVGVALLALAGWAR